VIPLTVLNSSVSEPLGRRSVEVEAVVDTGFTGHLTLPSEVVLSLDLLERGFVEVELADGGYTGLDVHEARVLWGDQQLPIPVYETEGEPLVGMSLLRGSRLTIDVVPDGVVVIENLG
jgi:clan AA aspartic protease